MDEARANEGLVCMIGTDHGLASADVRSAFVLPEEVREPVLSLARVKLGASGVVLLATCNRTELWASFDDGPMPERSLDEQGVPLPDDPFTQVFSDMFMVDAGDYARYLVSRVDADAVSHLFNVACGLRSAIVAEDQIVTQVKQAIAYSREIGVADSILEVLFRQAITAAKQVKSSVRFTRAYATAVDQALALLAQEGLDLTGATCMVIGNGEYGRLAASALVESGAEVLVTVRQYTHGAVRLPRGCTGVPYADRYSYLPRCQVVMSATTSPHYTLECDAFADACGDGHAMTLIDLAIPCDIEPGIAELPGCVLYGIDDFVSDIGTENKQAIAAAQRMLETGMSEFWDWVERRQAQAGIKPPPGAMFPMFFDISDKHAVFIGGGTIALRRVRTLIPFVGDITVYAPEFTPELEHYGSDGSITLVERAYEPALLDGADLVFACTNDRELNDEICAECKRRKILVNVCSDRFKCDFHFPGVVMYENMVVGVSAGGKDHRRVRQLRARIQRLLEEEDL